MLRELMPDESTTFPQSACAYGFKEGFTDEFSMEQKGQRPAHMEALHWGELELQSDWKIRVSVGFNSGKLNNYEALYSKV